MSTPSEAHIPVIPTEAKRSGGTCFVSVRSSGDAKKRSLDCASLRSASLGMTGFCHMRSPYPNGGEEYEKGRAALQSMVAYQLGDRSVGH